MLLQNMTRRLLLLPPAVGHPDWQRKCTPGIWEADDTYWSKVRNMRSVLQLFKKGDLVIPTAIPANVVSIREDKAPPGAVPVTLLSDQGPKQKRTVAVPSIPAEVGAKSVLPEIIKVAVPEPNADLDPDPDSVTGRLLAVAAAQTIEDLRGIMQGESRQEVITAAVARAQQLQG